MYPDVLHQNIFILHVHSSTTVTKLAPILCHTASSAYHPLTKDIIYICILQEEYERDIVKLEAYIQQHPPISRLLDEFWRTLDPLIDGGEKLYFDEYKMLMIKTNHALVPDFDLKVAEDDVEVIEY